MNQPHQRHSIPASAGRDIAFTRLAFQIQPHVYAAARELASVLKTAGLECRLGKHLNNQGVYTLLSCSGAQGSLFNLDFRLLDGLNALGQVGAALEVHLLSSDGEAVALVAPFRMKELSVYASTSEEVLAGARGSLSIIGLYELVAAHYDLVFERRRTAPQR